MSSNINTNTIDTKYPIAGQDNDTQGFRDNFASIKNNLDIASAEITSLQAKAAVSPSIIDNPPGSPTSAGVPGQIAYDANYLYVCIYTNTWVRASLASWS